MKFTILWYGILIFTGCLLIHIIAWRVRITRMSALLLGALFLAAPVTAACSLAAFKPAVIVSLGLSNFELMEILLLHVSLSLAYIAGYPAARAFSPSLDILLMVKTAPGGKMTEQDILDRYIGGRVVPPRFDTLRVYHLVRERAGRYELTAFGRALIRSFLLYRKLLGISPGRG